MLLEKIYRHNFITFSKEKRPSSSAWPFLPTLPQKVTGAQRREASKPRSRIAHSDSRHVVIGCFPKHLHELRF